MTRTHLPAWTLMLLMAAAPVMAQSARLVPLSLDEAIAAAIAESHRLAELHARQEGADATVQLRESAGRPMVTAIAGYTRTNHVDEFGVP